MLACLVCVLLLLRCPSAAQTGSEHEPIRYVGGVSIDLTPHEGRLRPAIGVANYQTFRANRTHPERAEGHGWTYNHAPMLAYWNDTFYQEYLSNPVDEHIAPGHTLVVTSRDGRNWTRPEVVFPAYEPPPDTPMPEGYNGYMMHQRMGFYIAPNGRLLVLGFYGHAENPFGPGGIGRVVREAYKDGTYGPIHFIRYSSHGRWNEGNTSYPLYTRSSDAGFVEACEALLADRLMRFQWYDEDRGPAGFYPLEKAAQALCFYHRKDGKVVALWKWALAALSSDEGESFSKPVKLPTITIDGAKMWGQRTADGRYAVVYNPTVHSEHRYPLAMATSDDGIIFDDLVLVHGEVPPRRFFGRWKDYGPQYVRGIAEGNGSPPGDAMWITYSMNKEDMWVSRIPVPVRYAVDGPVADTFDDMETGGHVRDWNIYSPLWAPVRVVEFPSVSDKSLELRDEDPHDYARAVRVFQEGTRAEISCRVLARQWATGMLDIEVMDRYGNRPVRLRFGGDGRISAVDGNASLDLQAYEAERWYTVDITVDAAPFGHYSVSIDGREVLSEAALAEAVRSVERLSFRTGPYRDEPTRQTDNEAPHSPLPGADEPAPLAVYNIGEVRAATTR
ncbi:MAG: hypothetical protein JSV65_16960 [Armatimonadota bacterium]|nr:MAG: hypothetical protein JSV65_16960 [Armatimonadota bacterium]